MNSTLGPPFGRVSHRQTVSRENKGQGQDSAASRAFPSNGDGPALQSSNHPLSLPGADFPNTADPESFAARLLHHATRIPDHLALDCDGERLSYQALMESASRCAARLQSLFIGTNPMGRVGVIADNSLDFGVVIVACQLAGVTLVPLPGLIAPQAQARMIDDAAITILFYDEAHQDTSRAAVGLSERGARVVLVPIGPTGEIGTAASHLAFWLRQRELDFRAIAIDPAGASDLIYSSGTTGVPKGILQSYGARVSQCLSLPSLGAKEGVGLLQTVGLYSNFGMSGFLFALWWGGAFFMMSKFSGPAVVALLAREAIDMAWFAPATLIRTLDAPGFGHAANGRSCIKVCAGAPLTAAQKQNVIDAWPGPFFDLFGQTETGTLTLLPVHLAPRSKLGSVGRPPPSVELRILDDAGHVLPVGEHGEIAARTGTLMSGYHNRPDADEGAAWTDSLGRPFIRTGDIGRMDDDGYLWLSDRKKDMILSGGFNIYPADIERELLQHPSIFEAAVVGYPSRRWGETPVAFVALREGAVADEEVLRAWVNERLGSIQKVASVKILAALPAGTLGKILKRELRDRFAPVLGELP